MYIYSLTALFASRSDQELSSKQLIYNQEDFGLSHRHLSNVFLMTSLNIFSCPGRMFANSISARLVATRMRVTLPRAGACPCLAQAQKSDH